MDPPVYVATWNVFYDIDKEKVISRARTNASMFDYQKNCDCLFIQHLYDRTDALLFKKFSTQNKKSA
ncbi:hypothetical protein SK128_013308 [Halocaridina rubra]|uniref:Uncharacterized protein n=1 Tax=Halocaridina rubra TaxID=373956 RepID=A0AAN8XQL5_HALRR